MSARRRIWLIPGLLLTVFLNAAGCSSPSMPSPVKASSTLEILEQTKEQLSPAELQELSEDWRDRGTVETRVVDPSTGLYLIDGIHRTGQFIVPKDFIGREVLIVTLPSKQRELVGDIQRVVDPVTGRIIGHSLRD